MYVDTSVAVKLYLPEEDSDRVQKTITSCRETNSAELLVTEMSSVLSRRVREGFLTAALRDATWNLFSSHVKAGWWNLLPVTRREFETAAELIHSCRAAAPLRALDSLHLAVCMNYRLFPLFTSDRVMKTAAAFLRIPIVEQQ